MSMDFRIMCKIVVCVQMHGVHGCLSDGCDTYSRTYHVEGLNPGIT